MEFNKKVTHSFFELRKDKDIISKSKMIGSQYVMEFPPPDFDIDYLVLSPDTTYLHNVLKINGYVDESMRQQYEGLSCFKSYRRLCVNLIVTGSKFFYYKFLLATWLCKVFKVYDKNKRIALHQFILYGKIPG